MAYQEVQEDTSYVAHHSTQVPLLLLRETHRKHSFKIALMIGRLSLSSKLGMRSWPTTASMSACARFALSGNWSIANMKVWRTARVYNGVDEAFSRTLFGEYLLQSRSQLGNIIKSVNLTTASEKCDDQSPPNIMPETFFTSSSYSWSTTPCSSRSSKRYDVNDGMAVPCA